LKKIIKKYTAQESPPEEIKQLMEPLVRKHLLLREGSKYLALAVPVEKNTQQIKLYEQIQLYRSTLEEKKHQEALQSRITSVNLSQNIKTSDKIGVG